MQSETVRQVIDIENLILAEHEHLRQELDLRLQKLQEETRATLSAAPAAVAAGTPAIS